MRIVKLKKENFLEFMEGISTISELIAPIRNGDKVSFQPVKDFNKIDLNATRTILPPKKFFVPSSFAMFRISNQTYEPDFSHIKNRILFGIHPCDIHGLLVLDRLFMQELQDPYYTKARISTLIIGVSCMPDDYCMAKSMGTHVVEEGFDLFLNDLGSFYLVFIGSSKGDDLIRLKTGLFEETITGEDIQKYVEWQTKRDASYKNGINFIAMPRLMELKYRDAFWDKLDLACLSCGSCSMVCPTCNCYNVVDRKEPGESPVERVRHWDSCTLHDYSLVAGGENFRKSRKNRLKLFYTHKLEAYAGKYGKPGCVGCGRCIVICPVGINVKSVAQALEGNEIKEFWNIANLEVLK